MSNLVGTLPYTFRKCQSPVTLSFAWRRTEPFETSTTRACTATRAGKRSRSVKVLLCERSHTLCVASYYTIGQPAQAIATTIQFYLLNRRTLQAVGSPLKSQIHWRSKPTVPIAPLSRTIAPK